MSDSSCKICKSFFCRRVETMSDSSPYSPRKTVVIWDLKDCPIPEGLDGFDISRNVTEALANSGYYCRFSVRFRAYCDYFKLDDRLGFTDIGIMHVDAEAKDERRKKMLVDLFSEASGYRTPINVLMIMGDMSGQSLFIKALKYLKANKCHNVLLAQPQKPSSQDLLDSVSKVWLWETLSVGGYPIDHNGSEDDTDTDSED